MRLRRARLGVYTITARRVRVGRRSGPLLKGAKAYPDDRRRTVRLRSQSKTVKVRYGTIVNPRVRRAPGKLLSVAGEPSRPTALIYEDRRGLRLTGQTLLAGPSEKLPHGLTAKVTKSRLRGHKRILSIRHVASNEAVPAFRTDGPVKLEQVDPGVAGRVRAACAPGAPINVKIEEAEIRRAESKLWRPQLSITLAVRPRVYFGTSGFSGHASIQWCMPVLPSFQAAIPTPVGPLPVFGGLEAEAGAEVNGTLGQVGIGAASTSVMDLDLGTHNRFALHQEGTNVWTTVSTEPTASGKIYASINGKFGVGSGVGANLHVKFGFGPTLAFTAGKGCSLGLDFGSLSAGAQIGPIRAGTPSWTPFTQNLWSGCSPSPHGSPSPQPAPTSGSSPAAPDAESSPQSSPPSAKRTIEVFNKLTNGSAGYREDSTPARLTTKPWKYCTSRGCNVAGTERHTGGTYYPAVCWTTGDVTTNGENGSSRDDAYQYTSDRYYGVTYKGVTRFVSWVWIHPKHRGGLGLPRC